MMVAIGAVDNSGLLTDNFCDYVADSTTVARPSTHLCLFNQLVEPFPFLKLSLTIPKELV